MIIKDMEIINIVPMALLGFALSVPASAASFSSQAAFVDVLQPGYVFNNFNSATGAGNPYDLSQGSFAFNATTDDATSGPGGSAVVFPLDLQGSVALNIGGGDHFGGGDTLTMNFTSNNVTAVGGDFFLTDFFGDLASNEFTLTLSDGSIVSFSDAGSDNFFGYTSSTPITSLSFNPGASNSWAVIDNLFVGQVAAAPEPSSWLLLVSGIGAAAGLIKFSKRSA